MLVEKLDQFGFLALASQFNLDENEMYVIETFLYEYYNDGYCREITGDRLYGMIKGKINKFICGEIVDGDIRDTAILFLGASDAIICSVLEGTTTIRNMDQYKKVLVEFLTMLKNK